VPNLMAREPLGRIFSTHSLSSLDVVHVLSVVEKRRTYQSLCIEFPIWSGEKYQLSYKAACNDEHWDITDLFDLHWSTCTLSYLLGMISLVVHACATDVLTTVNANRVSTYMCPGDWSLSSYVLLTSCGRGTVYCLLSIHILLPWNQSWENN